MGFKIKQKGNWSNTFSFLKKVRKIKITSVLDKYGKIGVEKLRAATPKDSGKTSELWSYSIEEGNGISQLIFSNSNINDGCNIAIILQYGHATNNGSWVEGTDYINPALKDVFKSLSEDVWKEAIS